VKKKLPREKKSHFVYEINLNEEEYNQNYESLDSFLTNPDIEGVYETNLPLSYKFI